MFIPLAVKTVGKWNHLAVELIQELGQRISAITQDTRETGFLFQRNRFPVSTAVGGFTMGNAV